MAILIFSAVHAAAPTCPALAKAVSSRANPSLRPMDVQTNTFRCNVSSVTNMAHWRSVTHT
eukprot:2748853-Pyramimonas_sp.AAC.1